MKENLEAIRQRFTLKPEAFYLAVIVILVLLLAYRYAEGPGQLPRVYYNQEHDLSTEVVDAVNAADRYAYFAVYTFTRGDIRDALLAAKRRGVDVRGVTEGDQYRDIAAQRSIVKDLQKAGIPVAVDTNGGLMHLKVLVTDRGYLSGSYNWTASATNQNDEVLEIGTDEAVRDAYKAILEELFARYPSADDD